MRVYNLLSSEYAISNLRKHRIKISRYSELNDPFELMAGNLSDKRFRSAVKKWKAKFNESKGLICFSRNWSNPVLWSHYGDRHRGIALGFDLDDQFANEIQYSSQRLPVRFVDDNPEHGLDPDFVSDMLHTKYEHWQYEQEVRLHVGLEEGTQEDGRYFYPFGSELILKEVILGHNCATSIENLHALVAPFRPTVTVLKGRLAFQDFRVVVDQRSVEET